MGLDIHPEMEPEDCRVCGLNVPQIRIKYDPSRHCRINIPLDWPQPSWRIALGQRPEVVPQT